MLSVALVLVFCWKPKPEWHLNLPKGPYVLIDNLTLLLWENWCYQQNTFISSPELIGSQTLLSSQTPGEVTAASWLLQSQKCCGNKLVWETDKEIIACDALGRCWGNQPHLPAGYFREPGTPLASLIRGYSNQQWCQTQVIDVCDIFHFRWTRIKSNSSQETNFYLQIASKEPIVRSYVAKEAKKLS